MKIRLHTYSSLFEIQSDFTKKFPGVKIDFIFHGDEKLNLSSHHSSFLFTPVEEFYPDCAADNIIIYESMTTREVEELFESHWHLPAKVYVEIGGYWQKNKKTESRRLKECVTLIEI
jgi:hypothetical protein